MRVRTLGGLGSMPVSFAPGAWRNPATGVTVPGAASYVPSNVRGRGTHGMGGLGEAGLTESMGLMSLGALLGGAIGFVIGAWLVSAASSRRW